MSDEDRERRRREIQEATRDHNERAAERRAKAVAEAREVLLGPGAPDLPSALDLPAAHETRGEFVDPFPWRRDEPSKQDELFHALLEWAKANEWPCDDEAVFQAAQRLDQLADDVSIFDTPYDAATHDNARPIPTIRELLTLDNDALARAFNRAPDRLQRYVENLARQGGVRLDPCGDFVVPTSDLRRILSDIVDTSGGSLKGRPSTTHIDAVADETFSSYEVLSGARPRLSRGAADCLSGPLVRFVDMIGRLYGLPLAEESRLRAALRRWKAQ